ncbi:FkbO/Hyg5 family chorismatase [Streptomyces sp. SBT349]|uniref:FkbO/Hyg5 family chorismatase n=1 Tax=Streptomyces sp. SBT349 TaxID=1580539 RepID=UPI00099D0160|nr:FkbO/Hyg5 family chorismatase [Streptomyces sp. SBT349]
MIDVAISTGKPSNNCGEILGVVEFGGQARKPDLDAGYPTVGIAMGDPSHGHVCETWTSTSEVSTGRQGDIVYGHDRTHLFGALQLPPSDRYRDATRTAYRQLLALISDLDYPHLVRMWNYIPDINRPNCEGLEIYRDFCQGRAEGFGGAGAAMASRLSAATGVGSRGGGIMIYFIAERSGTPVHFESPRQVPAHQYPRAYGPRSPSFSRATFLPASKKLFLSGTASIVGHRSVNLEYLEGQCDTTLENIRVLLEYISRKSDATVDLDSFSLLKVYVRHESDALYVRKRLGGAVAPGVPIEIFNTDICRSELLLEVEGVLDMNVPDHHGDTK